jgi:hypothetical protein
MNNMINYLPEIFIEKYEINLNIINLFIKYKDIKDYSMQMATRTWFDD